MIPTQVVIEREKEMIVHVFHTPVSWHPVSKNSRPFHMRRSGSGEEGWE